MHTMKRNRFFDWNDRWKNTNKRRTLTRKYLRDCDEYNLAKHSVTTDSGQWLYTDEDIIQLEYVLICREAGFSRKELVQRKSIKDMTCQIDKKY